MNLVKEPPECIEQPGESIVGTEFRFNTLKNLQELQSLPQQVESKTLREGRRGASLKYEGRRGGFKARKGRE